MNTLCLKTILLLLLISAFAYKSSLYCQEDGLIDIEFDVPVNDSIVDVGIIKRGDSLNFESVITNLSDNTLYFANLDPYYFLGDPLDYECELCNTFFRSDFSAGLLASGAEKKVSYWHNGILLDRVKDRDVFVADLYITPSTDEELDDTTYNEDTRRFRLLGRATDNDLGTYVKFQFQDDSSKADTIRFDTILSNGYESTKYWSFRNVSDNEITIEHVYIESISNNKCDNFRLNDIEIPQSLAPKREVYDIPIIHSAINNCSTNDTVLIRVDYESAGKSVADSVVAIATSINYGLSIRESQTNGLKDSVNGNLIDIGFIPVSEISDLKIILDNFSTLPIEIDSISEFILNPAFNGDVEIISYPQNKPLDSEMVLDLSLKPKQTGLFNVGLTIYTDLEENRFTNQKSESNKIEIRLRGRAIGPNLYIENDTLDFGNVIISGDCEQIVDTLFPITNTGNDTLRISSPGITTSSFSTDSFDTIIAPSQQFLLPISFSPSGLGNYNSSLVISTNQVQENEKVLFLKGAADLSSNTRLFSYDQSSKPGRRIIFPLVLSSSNIEIAESFSALLEYDGSLLSYAGTDINNTASAQISSSSIIGPEKDSIGSTFLRLNLLNEQGSSFLNDTILIKLLFDTYLGNGSSTNIRIISPRFSNSNCGNVINLVTNTPVYYLDSVIGLESKVFDKSRYLTPSISSVSHNGSSFQIVYETVNDADIKLLIYDVYGREIDVLNTDISYSDSKCSLPIAAERIPYLSFLMITSNDSIIYTGKYINNLR